MGSDVRFGSADEAVVYCRGLIAEGRANLFRGQSNDWPAITPSLVRGSGEQRDKARTSLDDFIEWATFVPQMALYHESTEAVTAIAQHYGIPTAFLDLTTKPEIAELFACAAPMGDLDGDAVIYCFLREQLQLHPSFRVIEIDVDNLWRLQAQHGLFLEYLDETKIADIRDAAIRVHFPRRAITPTETTQLYPLRKSALEVTIDQWIYRKQVSDLFALVTSAARRSTIRRYTYPGMFRWRAAPDFDGAWVKYNPGWVFPPNEHIRSVIASRSVMITLTDADDVWQAFSTLEAQFRPHVEAYVRKNSGVAFEMKFADHEQHDAAGTMILNRCWDGVRVHPYRTESAIRCLAATALALFWKICHPDALGWDEQLWGEVECIDTAPVGGHLDAATVSRQSLLAARHASYDGQLTRHAARRSEADPFYLMDYVVDPWVLFDFERLSTLFVEQFIPSCIGSYWNESIDNNEGVPGELWGLSFNSALLAAVTRFGFRFTSPTALEPDIERIIFVAPDMDEDDIEEIFISCVPSIYKEGVPFVVRFTNYNNDPREIWAIDRVIEQCQMIVRVGGISVLEVLPSARNETPELSSMPPALGAFHIWAIANRRVRELNSSRSEVIRPIFDQFYSELPASNANIDRRAESQVDWPLRDKSISESPAP